MVSTTADFGMARAYSPRPLTPGVSDPFQAAASYFTVYLYFRDCMEGSRTCP